jgi:hypothetical protein
MTEEMVVGGGSYCVTCWKCYKTFPSTFRKNKLARLDVKQFNPNLIFAVKAEALHLHSEALQGAPLG